MGQNSSKPKQELDDLLKLEAERAALQFKVLLLGAGESGKSTVIKQLKLIYQRKDMNDKWFMSWVPILHGNTFQCMQTLLQTAEKFGYPFEEKYAEYATRILEIKIEDEPTLTEELANIIDELWKHDSIQKTYARRSEYWLLECANYYFENAKEMAQDGFKPSEEHIVMARARTTGIIITEIEREELLWRIVDVGGQRSERKKWIRCFDDVKAIVFVVNLAGYSSVLFEDPTKNRMKEEIELFGETVQNPVFKHTPIFLFLNKKDLFEDTIRKYPLSNLFPDFKGGEDVHASIEFIASQFRAKMDPAKQENFRCWDISARYKKDVKYSFQEFMDIIRKSNLATINRALTNLKREKKKGSKPVDSKKEEAERLKQEKIAREKKEKEDKEIELQKSIELDRQLEEQRLLSNLQYKILCLGPGESGKSTFIKQLKLIYLGKPTPKEIEGYVPILHQNVIQTMQTLLKAGAQYGFKLNGEGEIEAAKTLIKLVSDEEPELTTEVADAVTTLWKSKAIQQAYEKREEYWLLDSASYYFEHVYDFAKEDFVPSEDDIIMARARTTGIIETFFNAKDITWKVVDVGGQRSERKKWIKCFDDVNAIMYIVNLGGYNSVLFEDQNKNRMHESLDLFGEVCSNPAFKNCPIFLFLNKKDLFEEKLRHKSIVECFPDFKGNPHNTSDNIAFIASKFESRLQAGQKIHFKWWPIAARYKKDVKYSFQELTDILVKANQATIKKTVAALAELRQREHTEKEKKSKDVRDSKEKESKKSASTESATKKEKTKLVKTIYITDNVEEHLDQERAKSVNHRKLLLLGPGESGKSTVIKQLKFINDQMTKEETLSFLPALQINVLHSMRALLLACKDRDLKFDEEGKKAVERVLKAVEGHARASVTPGQNQTKFLTKKIAKDIRNLWAHETVKKAWEFRSEFWILENAAYYFDHVMDYIQEDYQPNETDVVLGRARTTGIIHTEFEEPPYTWTVVDVGGQRSERRKWIKCFQDVTAIIFVVNLAGYNSVLFEDQKKNRMHEALSVFEDITSNPIFTHTPFFLILNKKDLFEQGLRLKGIDECFPDFKGKRHDTMENITFIANKFRAKLRVSQQEFFEWWLVSAAERREVKYCFEELKESVNKALSVIKVRLDEEKADREKERPQDQAPKTETSKAMKKKAKELQKKKEALKKKNSKKGSKK